MIRKLLLHLAVFLLPFIAYAGFVVLAKRAEARGQVWHEAPWYWLTIIGLVLFSASLAATAFLGGEAPGGRYVPPHTQDGVIVPGHTEPAS